MSIRRTDPAAQRGDVVYHANVRDLEKLNARFPATRVLAMG